MSYRFYVRNQTLQAIPVIVRPANKQDLKETISQKWDSDWTSGAIHDQNYLLYSFRDALSGTLIALCAYEDNPEGYCVRIVYGEAEPKSHPRLVAKREERRYTDIGKVIIAFGVQLSLESGYDGTVFFKAKTTELYHHYKRAFRAKDIFSENYALIIYDEEAVAILNEFKEETA